MQAYADRYLYTDACVVTSTDWSPQGDLKCYGLEFQSGDYPNGTKATPTLRRIQEEARRLLSEYTTMMGVEFEVPTECTRIFLTGYKTGMGMRPHHDQCSRVGSVIVKIEGDDEALNFFSNKWDRIGTKYRLGPGDALSLLRSQEHEVLPGSSKRTSLVLFF
jgi:hypothetical protein